MVIRQLLIDLAFPDPILHPIRWPSGSRANWLERLAGNTDSHDADHRR
jgi:hypothetical protein